MIDIRDAERFYGIGWDIVGDCHIWKGYKNYDGYGTFRLGNSMVGAHRASYMVHVDDIPKGKVIRHRCDNPPCVNPEHLKPGTVKDNVHDAMKRGRRSPQDHENNHGAKLSWEDAREIRRLYKETNLSQEKIGNQFGITQVRVSQIVLNKSWVEDF